MGNGVTPSAAKQTASEPAQTTSNAGDSASDVRAWNGASVNPKTPKERAAKPAGVPLDDAVYRYMGQFRVLPPVPGKPGLIPVAAPGPAVAGAANTTGAPGSSPDTAIPVSLKVAVDTALPDAGVVAVRFAINAPGADKIPGLKAFIDQKGQISGLVAVLTPVAKAGKDGLPEVAVDVPNSTLFLSLNRPGSTFPVIITLRPEAGGFELGTRIRNQTWGRDARGNPLFIGFSNERGGFDLKPGEIVASTNAGLIAKVPSSVEKFVKRAVNNVISMFSRGAEVDEAAAALAATPETGGASDAAGAVGILATEAGRALLTQAVNQSATPYVGVAYRGSFNFGIRDGHLTIQAQKGPWKGKWIEVDPKTISAFLGAGSKDDRKVRVRHWRHHSSSGMGL